jgi:hypothetical protein
MAAQKDQSGWLPTPPPPRPARRDAAIEAALRRFDGAEDAAPPAREGPRRSWASTHRPQLAMAFSAMLLVVVGVPAALIGLRNSPSTSEHAPPTVVARDTTQVASEKPSAPKSELADVAPSAPAPPAAPEPRQLRAADSSAGVDSAPVAQTAPLPPTVAAPPAPAPVAPMMATAPPPPPPPPPAPAARGERSSEAMADNVIVTGSRISEPSRAASSGLQAKTAERAAAIDPAYVSFLSRLQTAVRANDHRAVIEMIAFPLRVTSGGTTRLYPDAQSVERDFDRIFTPRLKRSILNQRADRLAIRGGAVMVGNGELQLSATPGSVRIEAVGP